MMAADQRHRDRSVFGQGDDRRFGPLVVEQRTDGADQDAARAQADDRPPGGEQLGDLRHNPVVGLVPIARQPSRAVEARPRQQIAHPSAERGAAGTQRDDRGAGRQLGRHNAGPSREISAVAKYGTLAGSTCASGSIRWFGKLARSM